MKTRRKKSVSVTPANRLPPNISTSLSTSTQPRSPLKQRTTLANRTTSNQLKRNVALRFNINDTGDINFFFISKFQELDDRIRSKATTAKDHILDGLHLLQQLPNPSIFYNTILKCLYQTNDKKPLHTRKFACEILQELLKLNPSVLSLNSTRIVLWVVRRMQDEGTFFFFLQITIPPPLLILKNIHLHLLTYSLTHLLTHLHRCQRWNFNKICRTLFIVWEMCWGIVFV
jgi:hypothetical protein